jgi:hypothetical protein
MIAVDTSSLVAITPRLSFEPLDRADAAIPEAALVGVDIGLRRRFEMASRERDEPGTIGVA